MKTLFFIFGFFILSTFLAATIINVPADQPTIQEGIDVSVDGDTVLVQPDTYIENIDYNGKSITVASLFLATQDTTYISQTIIDGNQDDSVVKFESGEDSTAVLCGFTITNGSAAYQYGGGICISGGSPTINNNIITGNFSHHDPAATGGGISCRDNSNPTISNNTISSNSSSSSGGGIHCVGSNPTISNNIISNNTAGDMGGGIGIGGGCSNPTISNNTIINNTVSGLFLGGHGGGIFCGPVNAIISNNTISGNSADFGGGICCHGSNATISNNTISGNTAELGGGGIFCGFGSSANLINCILWNDSPEEIYFYFGIDPNSITISYSDIQGGEAGIVTNGVGTVNWLEGNLHEDPLFVGTGEDPYSLLEDSPCIDAGDPDTLGLNLSPWDIIGNLRIWDGDGNGIATIDMGAYEYGAPPYVEIDDNVIVQTPEVFLHQNYPNPFNPKTTIYYQLPVDGEVELKIYNIKGQKVKTLVNERLEAGKHSVVWNGRDSNGKRVGSGIYFNKLRAGNFQKVRKMVLMK